MNSFLNLKSFFHTLTARIRDFSVQERFFFTVFVIIFLSTSFIFLVRLSTLHTEKLPAYGGTLREGAVGVPRFINPLFAQENTELDLTRLIYSGLLRKIDEGKYIPDLAESYTLSPDGKVYTFILQENIRFHNNAKITTDDVLFTTETIADPKFKSPLAVNWQGVVVKKVDARTITFTLSQPFAGFLDSLTVGILPKNIWSSSDANSIIYDEHNIDPIGSGPYYVARIQKNKDGSPKVYILRSFKKFTLGKPSIAKIKYTLFADDEELATAFESDFIDSAHSLIHLDRINTRQKETVSRPLTRMFGLFFNAEKKNPLLSPHGVNILESMIDKDLLIHNVYGGYAHPLSSAIPLFILPDQKNAYDPERARSLMQAAGWTYDNASGILRESSDSASGALSLSLATGNAPYLLATAEHIKNQLERFGIRVTITPYDSETLTETVLRKRDFDVLLFGQSFQHDTALYAFWHSSQRTYPGLNITQYINTKTDDLLERARKESNQELRFDDYRTFNQVIMQDTPALFLYSPDFIYSVPKELSLTLSEYLAQPQDRFNRIYTWHIRSHTVWKSLLKK